MEILLKCTSQHSKIKSLRTGMDRWANLSSYVTSGKIILVAERWMRSNVSLPFFYIKLYQAGAPYNKIDLTLLVKNVLSPSVLRPCTFSCRIKKPTVGF